jgi:hypothetical protein
MSTLTVSTRPSALSFPRVSVEAKLRDELLTSVKSLASLREITLPSTTGEIYAIRFHIDSLEVVNILCAADKIVGFELKNNIVKAGGYESINEAVSHVMPRIESAWMKHQFKGATK